MTQNLKEEILKEMSIGMFGALADETPDPYVTEVDEEYNDVDGDTPDGETANGDINRKSRVYVDSPEEVPEGFEVQEGQQGGLYYETDEAPELTEEEWVDAGLDILDDFDEDDYRWEYWEDPTGEELEEGAIVHLSDEMFAMPGETEGPRGVIVEADNEAGEYAVVTEDGEMVLAEDFESLMNGEAEQGVSAVWDSPDQDNIRSGWDQEQEREQEQEQRQQEIEEGERAPHWAEEDPLEDVDSPAPEGGLEEGELYRHDGDIVELQRDEDYDGDVPVYETEHINYSEIDGVLCRVGRPNDIHEGEVEYFDFTDEVDVSDGWYNVGELTEDEDGDLHWELWNEEEGLVEIPASDMFDDIHGVHRPQEYGPSTPDMEATPDPSGDPDPDTWSIDWDATDEGKTGNVLPMDEKKLLMREWKAAVDTEAAESVSETIRSVKDSTYNTDGQKYDKLIQAVMDADGDPREGDFADAEEPTEEEVEAMQVLQEASQKFFETHYGDETGVHRGLADYSHENLLPAIGEMFQNGEEISGQELQLRDNPAGVWTTEEGAARTFTIVGGTAKSLMVSEDIGQGDVFNMPDAIYPYEEREETASEDSDWDEGEVNIPSHGRDLSADEVMVVNAQERKDDGSVPKASLSQVVDDPLSVMEAGDAAAVARFVKTLDGLDSEEFYDSYVEELRSNDEITNHEAWDTIEEQIKAIEYDPSENVLFDSATMDKDDGPIVIDVKHEAEADWLNVVNEHQRSEKAAILNDVIGLLKARRYVDDPQEAPDWAEVQEGPQGGLYYETTETNDEQTELDDYGGDDDDDGTESDGVDYDAQAEEYDYEADINPVVEEYLSANDISLEIPGDPGHELVNEAHNDWDDARDSLSDLLDEGHDPDDVFEIVSVLKEREKKLKEAERTTYTGGSHDPPETPDPIEAEELEEWDGELPDDYPDDIEPLYAVADMADSYRQFRESINQQGMMDISNRELDRWGRALSGDPDWPLQDLESLESDEIAPVANEDPETFRRISEAREGDGQIAMFRAVPENVEDVEIGDYVALNPEYVQRHGENVLGGQQDEEWHIVEEEVPIEDVAWPGEVADEFVYSPKDIRERWPSQKAFYEEVSDEDTKAKILNTLTEKARRYVDDPSEAPEDVEVQEGPQGGLYYETDSTGESKPSDGAEGEGEAPSEETTEAGRFTVGWGEDIPPVAPGSEIVYEVDGREKEGTVTEVAQALSGEPVLQIEEEGPIRSSEKHFIRGEDGWEDLSGRKEMEIDREATETAVPDEDEIRDGREEWNENTAGEWSDFAGFEDRHSPTEVPFDKIEPGDEVRIAHPSLGGSVSMSRGYGGERHVATVLHSTDSRMVVETEDGRKTTIDDKAIKEVKREPGEEVDYEPLDYDSVSVESAFDELPDDVTYGRTRNIEPLREKYDDAVVDYVEGLMEMWGKYDYGTDPLADFWVAAAKLGDVDAPEYAKEQVDSVFDEDVFRALADKMRMDRKAAKQQFGDSVTLYRGINQSTIDNYAEVDDDGVTITPQSMESWTQKQSLAQDFGDVMLELEWDTDNVGFYRSDELTLIGHGEYTVPHENLEGDIDG